MYFFNLLFFIHYLFSFVVVEAIVKSQDEVTAPPVLDERGVTLFVHVATHHRCLLVSDVMDITGGHLQLHNIGI